MKKHLDKAVEMGQYDENVESVTIQVFTRRAQATYLIVSNFTGRIAFEFNQGGLAAVEKLERLK